jgi:hypothetical protein
MIDQQERVRASFTCVCCGGTKDQGVLLCWPCHHAQKRRHELIATLDLPLRFTVAVHFCERIGSR